MNNPLVILREASAWAVINKPGGIATERHYNYDTVEARAQVQWQRPKSTKPAFVGIVHRLDRPVSGALLLAKKKSALKTLNQTFADQKTSKIYWAVTDRALPAESGELRHYLARDRTGKRAVASTRPLAGAKEARLRYRLLNQADGRYQYEITLLTGRYHQIRCQLSVAGAPIIGDHAYGAMRPLTDNCIALHARTLSFPDPATGEVISVEAPIPDYWPCSLPTL